MKNNTILDLTEILSSHQKLLSVVAYLLRWNRRSNIPAGGRHLTSDDLNLGFFCLLRRFKIQNLPVKLTTYKPAKIQLGFVCVLKFFFIFNFF